MKNNNNNDVTKTYYLRGAQGKPLAIYEEHNGTMKIKSYPLYRQERLGVYKANMTLDGTPHNDSIFTRELLKRTYALKDHLGNVRARITDRKQYHKLVSSKDTPALFTPELEGTVTTTRLACNSSAEP